MRKKHCARSSQQSKMDWVNSEKVLKNDSSIRVSVLPGCEDRFEKERSTLYRMWTEDGTE